MGASASSQRISFAQLVLDMGLADKAGLVKAKKLIKAKKDEGEKITIARACVELGVLSEKQAKKVQLELKRIKQGLASSGEFDAAAEAAKPRKKKKAKAKQAAGEDGSGEGAVEADASTEAKPAAKKKAKAKDEDASAEAKPAAKKKAKADDEDAAAEAKPAAKKAKAKADAEDASAEAKPAAKKAKAKDEDASAEAKPAKKAKAKADAEDASAEAQPAAKKAKAKADAEDEAAEAKPTAKKKAEDEAAEDEAADEGKAKKPGVKGKAPTKKLVGAKAKIGKEIPLGKKGPATAKRRPLGAAAKAEGEEPTRPNKTSLYALVGLVTLVLVVAAVGVALSKKDADAVVAQASPAPGAPGAGGVEVEVPAASPQAISAGQPNQPAAPDSAHARKVAAGNAWDKYGIGALDMADSGKFKEALALLDQFPQEHRDSEVWRGEGDRVREKIQKFVALQEEVEAAMAAAKGGDAGDATKLVKRFEHPKFEQAGESAIAVFKGWLREALGDEAYDDIVYKQTQEVDSAELASLDLELEGGTREDQIEILEKKAPEIVTRGSDQRRTKFREAQATARQNLEQARKVLQQREAAAQAIIDAEASRVKNATKKSPINFDGDDWKVTAYDANGFTVDGKKKGERTYGWGNAPSSLGHDVKFKAYDLEDAAKLYDLGLYALKRGLFDHARRHFEQTVKKDNSYNGKIPDIESLRHAFEPFRGVDKIGEGTNPTEVTWDFKETYEAQDFDALGEGMEVAVVGGQLKIATPTPQYRVTMAKVRGSYEAWMECKAELAKMNPAPCVGFSSDGGLFVVQFGDKTQLLTFGGKDGTPPLATSDVKATQGSEVFVGGKLEGQELAITVKIGDRDCFSHKIPWDGKLEMVVGALGHGDVRFGKIQTRGQLDPKWLRRAKASGPNEVARALSQFERQQSPSFGKLPSAFAETSAEDTVGLEGVSSTYLELVKQGRDAIKGGNEMAAYQAFQNAARQPDFAAANYLLALFELRRDPEGALFRCDRALKAVEDFYEAHAARALALLRIGRAEEAKAAVEKAIELRPDFAFSYVTKARLQILDGEYMPAVDTLKLAGVLSEGDPDVESAMMQARALAEGPAWALRKRVVSENYVLDTDYVEDADRLSLHLEAIRQRYVEAFPNMINKSAPKKKSSVLVFTEPEDYYQYSYRTTQDRSENTLGHFNPSTGQLLLFLDAEIDDPGAMHVLYHEGTHQWMHGNQSSLPFWANEGVAEYVGGTLISHDGKITERAITDSFLKGRLRSLTENWENRSSLFDIMNESPQEFYSGHVSLKYAMGWTLVHFFMESGDEKLKKTFITYLNRFKEVVGEGGDKKEVARDGMALQYVYLDTFYELDMEDVTKRWEAWVKKMSEKCGVPFPGK